MDATKRPIRIPPKYGNYAEQHNIFELCQELMSNLLINRPTDPLDFLEKALQKDYNQSNCIAVLGGPISGKSTIALQLSRRLACPLITREELLQSAKKSHLGQEINMQQSSGQPVSPDLLAGMVELRIKDCTTGWILEGIPANRQEAHEIQKRGILPKRCIILDAPDEVLIERAPGKSVNPDTGEIYHTMFNWPKDKGIASKLVANNEARTDIEFRLAEYKRHLKGIKDCYKSILKVINADQPISDVFAQVMSFVTSQPRTCAPRTPRVVLLGPPGSGKKTQAALLSQKYKLILISSGQLVREAIQRNSDIGKKCKTYVENFQAVPDDLLGMLINARLSEVDASTLGWVMYGYPKSKEQAVWLQEQGFLPNRIFMLEVTNETILDRLSLRSTDPVTGRHHHLLINPPPSDKVKDRLKVNPRDDEAKIKERVAEFYDQLPELEESYEQILRVNADQDPHAVFETLESMLVNPPPVQV